MDVGALLDHALDGGGLDFAVGGGDEEDLGAVGEEFGRAAFVGLHMGDVRAQNAVVGLAERGEGKGVGGGAVEGEEDFAVGLEEVAEEVGGLLGPLVIAVAALVGGVGLFHGLPGLGADAGVVVAGELSAMGGGTRELGAGL